MTINKDRCSTFQWGLAAALLILSSTSFAATINVNNTADLASASCWPGMDTCTLREAISLANANVGLDTVFVPAGHYALSLGGINEDGNLSGDLDITDDVVIIGASTDTTIIDAQSIDRVFQVWDARATLSNLTITGGYAPPTGTWSTGGGVDAHGSPMLIIEDARLTNNKAAAGGAAFVGNSIMLMQDSVVEGNSVYLGPTNAVAPAIYGSYSRVTLERTAIINSRCAPEFPQCAAVSLESCVAFSGGGYAVIRNSTIGNNPYRALNSWSCSLTVDHSTIAGQQYGLNFGSYDGNDQFTLRGSIIANELQDCYLGSGIIATAGGKNLDTDGTCSLSAALGDFPADDPELGSLGYAGESSPAFQPKLGLSPAIDVASSCFSNTLDQHGYTRPDGASGNCDLGSIEALPCASGNPDLILIDPLNQGFDSGTWQACRTLTASGFDLHDHSSATFLARDSIVLASGFSIPATSTFSARIERTANSTP